MGEFCLVNQKIIRKQQESTEQSPAGSDNAWEEKQFLYP